MVPAEQPRERGRVRPRYSTGNGGVPISRSNASRQLLTTVSETSVRAWTAAMSGRTRARSTRPNGGSASPALPYQTSRSGVPRRAGGSRRRNGPPRTVRHVVEGVVDDVGRPADESAEFRRGDRDRVDGVEHRPEAVGPAVGEGEVIVAQVEGGADRRGAQVGGDFHVFVGVRLLEDDGAVLVHAGRVEGRTFQPAALRYSAGL